MADYTTSTDVLMSEAHEQARRLGIVSGDGSKHNDSVDAFRHAYASARLTQMYWDDAPRKFGLKHEQENLTDEFNKHKVGETVEMKTQRVEKVKSEILRGSIHRLPLINWRIIFINAASLKTD